jgi:tRNA threonylcarbamoyladenosine biosynthesis protein TsaE
MSQHVSRYLPDEQATQALGADLGAALPPQAVVFLHGDLGAGKTTLVRALLRALGYEGAVRSPTYTLVEPYQLSGRAVYHLDLYRLADPEELEFLGLRDMLAEPCLMLIEWPQRGTGMLPAPDLHVRLVAAGAGRHVEVEAASAAGEAALECLNGRNS